MLVQSLLQNARNAGDTVAVIDDPSSHTRLRLAAQALRRSQFIAKSTKRDAIGVLLPS